MRSWCIASCGNFDPAADVVNRSPSPAAALLRRSTGALMAPSPQRPTRSRAGRPRSSRSAQIRPVRSLLYGTALTDHETAGRCSSETGNGKLTRQNRNCSVSYESTSDRIFVASVVSAVLQTFMARDSDGPANSRERDALVRVQQVACVTVKRAAIIV